RIEPQKPLAEAPFVVVVELTADRPAGKLTYQYRLNPRNDDDPWSEGGTDGRIAVPGAPEGPVTVEVRASFDPGRFGQAVIVSQAEKVTARVEANPWASLRAGMTFPSPGGAFSAMAFSGRGTMILGAVANQVHVWRVTDGAPIRSLTIPAEK